MAESADPDGESDLGLHCLLRSVCPKTWDHYISVCKPVGERGVGSTSKWDDICVLLHNRKWSYEKGPVLNQHAAARGYTTQVFLISCLWHLSRANNPKGLISLCTLSILCVSSLVWGSQTGAAYSSWGLTVALYAFSLSSGVLALRSRLA